MSWNRANDFGSFADLSSDHTLCLTSLEAQVLELYDESNEVALEHALLKTTIELVEGISNLPALTNRTYWITSKS